MEDNNSYTEPELSPVIEDIEAPEEEISDLEYKDIIGEEDAYTAEMLPDGNEIDITFALGRIPNKQKKKPKKKKKQKKPEEEQDSNKEAVIKEASSSKAVTEEKEQGKPGKIGNVPKAETRKKDTYKEVVPEEESYKINTIEDLAGHIRIIPKETEASVLNDKAKTVAISEKKAQEKISADPKEKAESFKKETEAPKDSGASNSINTVNTYVDTAKHEDIKTFSIYYLGKSKEKAEKKKNTFHAEHKERIKENKPQSDKPVSQKEEKEKKKEENKKEKEEASKDYSRKVRIKGEGISAKEQIANAGRAVASAIIIQGADADSVDAEQKEVMYQAALIAGDVWESLGQMGLKASAKMAKEYAYSLEENTAKSAELISEGRLSINELRGCEKASVFASSLEQSGVDKKSAKYISRHREEIADAIEAKIELNEFAKKAKDIEHVFAKTKVMGKNVILLSKNESDRQKKLLKEDNIKFFDLYKSGSLNKNMIKTYFSYHEDELFGKMNPQKMNKKDLKKFIKKIESGKINVNTEHKQKILSLLKTYERSKRIRETKRLGQKGFVRTQSKRLLIRAIDNLKYSDDPVLEGVRNTAVSVHAVMAAKEFTKLSFYAISRIHRLNRKINPVLIAGRTLNKKALKPVGRTISKEVKKKAASSAAGKACKEGVKKAEKIKKNAKLLVKKSRPYKVAKKGAKGLNKAKRAASNLKNTKAVRKTASAIRKTTRFGRKARHVISIPFMPVRAVKKGIGKIYMSIRKAAIWLFCAIFFIVLLLVGLNMLSAAIQAAFAGQGTLFESTILDEKMPQRISRLKNKDLEKYQDAIDIATSPPKHDPDHIDSKGLYPDEAYFGVKLYHYGSPESPTSEDAGIYHNDIPGSETKRGYHIYFLDSTGHTIGNSTTNIRDVICLSAVMADNYYDDHYINKIDDLQDEIFNKLNPKPVYIVSELYNKEGNDRFPYVGKTYEQGTYYCDDEDVYNDAQQAKDEGVMFYKELSPKTEHGCTFDEESYDEDFDSWLDDMPSRLDFLPSWSDYAPDIDDYEDADGNIDWDSYNEDYDAAEEAYDDDYEQGEANYESAYSSWQDSKPDRNDEKYNYCPGHPVPGKNNNEEDPISVSYGYRDINIYVTVLTKEDVYKAFDNGSGVIKYKTPKNYECTEFEDNEIEFKLTGSYGDMLREFNKNNGWKSKKNREWCDELYGNDWEDIYGEDVYSDNTSLPSGKGALSEEQIKEIVESLGDVSEVRQEFVNYALNYVGQISYYWGGKPSVPGFSGNDFGKIIEEDYKGRNRKGLDCSGFVSWCYWSVTGIKPPGMNTSDFTKGLRLRQISFSEIKPGDVGLISPPGAKSNHIGIFAGFDEQTGRAKWVHCSGEPRNTVVCDTTNKFSIYYRLFD